MKNELGDKIRLQHILGVINEIQKYLHGVAFSEFLENSMVRFAKILF